MKIITHKADKNSIRRVSLVVFGTAVNVLLSYIMYRFRLPFTFDTIGTIFAAAVGGIFPGIVTAVASNTLSALFYEDAAYYVTVNVLIALYTAFRARKDIFKKPVFLVNLIVLTSVFSGFSIWFIQWVMLGRAQFTPAGEAALPFASATGLPFPVAFLATNIILSAFDKSAGVLVTFLVLRYLPADILKGIADGAWKQRPITDDELMEMRRQRKNIRLSMRTRTTLVLVVTSLVLVFAMGWVGLSLYIDDQRAEIEDYAWSTAKFAAEMIDDKSIDDFISYGPQASGYHETELMLSKILTYQPRMRYLYVVTVETAGVRFIFDVDGGNEENLSEEAYPFGTLVPFEEAFKPYISDLYAGREIAALKSDDLWGWLLTVYYPFKDKSGRTVCYIGVDAAMDQLTGFIRDFMTKFLLILSGLILLMIAFALWMTGIYNSYPVASMAAIVERFAEEGSDQERLDNNVKVIRSLDIHTGDEVEKLYNAICRMTENQAEQMRDIRRLSDSTAKMQDGLIVTMADMVESRDSDTGAHIQKTAAYVKIIVEGLKSKGYYAGKITPKFISDVVRSAPLHDVGKINISDRILNKPGKLTKEEFEIMKTHTTAGKEIIEKAISSVRGGSYLKEARNMAAYHHERWDGKGYPEGLHGEVIPLSARIMAVADVFDALTSNRVYKPAFSIEESIQIIREGSGTQFDPKCVEVLLDSLTDVRLVLKRYHQDE